MNKRFTASLLIAALLLIPGCKQAEPAEIELFAPTPAVSPTAEAVTAVPMLTPTPAAVTAVPTASVQTDAPAATAAPDKTATAKPSATATPKATAAPTATPTAAPTATSASGGSTSASGIAKEILALTNAERKAQGLSSLKYTSILQDAADIRAKECAQIDDVQHTRPDGSSYSTVAAETGVTFRELGENLFMSTGDNPVTAEDAMDAWMDSSSHRENILRSGFTHMCVSVAKSGNTVYIVQMFGSGLSN